MTHHLYLDFGLNSMRYVDVAKSTCFRARHFTRIDLQHCWLDVLPLLRPRIPRHACFCRYFCTVFALFAGFAGFLLQIVSMDGGHLKGEWNGVMLTLSCKDANNTIIHVATIIGPKENADLYQALLRTCKKNQQLKEFLEDSMTTYFTDGHKGSPAALKREGGDAQQRLCLKHITGNLTEKIGSVSTKCPLEVSERGGVKRRRSRRGGTGGRTGGRSTCEYVSWCIRCVYQASQPAEDTPAFTAHAHFI